MLQTHKTRQTFLKTIAVSAPLLAVAATASAGSGVTPQPKPGDPLPGLTAEQLERFFLGKEQFNRVFTPAEGLGPIFNQNSCGSCHTVPIGGAGSVTVTRFGYVDEKKGTFDPLDHLGGSLLQTQFIHEDCAEVVPPEANITRLRVTNSTLGMGLVEAIPDSDLVSNESVLNGRVHWVLPLEDDSELRAGRFGWKAQVATTLTFSGDAALMEMGITNRLLPDELAPNGDDELLEWCLDLFNAPQPNDVPDKDGFEFIDRITDFQRFLAPPPQTPKSGMSGEAVFMAIGCGACHRPSYVTSNDPSLEDAIRGQVIKPYSDFLLHNMGLLGDEIVQGDAGGYDFRTPSLWGVAFRDPLMHDGSVGGGTFENRMLQVIALHGVFGSAARPSSLAFNALSSVEKNQVIAFLASLGRREFDGNADGDVNDIDFAALINCYTGAGGSITADDACAVFDVDQDGSVDETDFAVFLMVYEGEQEECDLWQQLAAAVAPISVTIPKHCAKTPVCVGDLNNSGGVDVQDLLILLGAWGPCGKGDCPADLNKSGSVDVQDLLILLGAWGQCR
ncbi:MAG TPA: di-heme oxidoredictase family protein [Phycisphaerales bacterium]|nr:di-heme oxidoredictase family protein [Phycisphaerales bacterium]HRQ76652.1 di-heme oxidoredictase family protein [Phycisphaerales bacterium]